MESHTERELRRVLREITARFPSPDFDVSVTRWEGRGTSIDIDAIFAHQVQS